MQEAKIVSVHSGKVLEVRYGSKADGAPIVQSADRAKAHQRWQVIPADGVHQIVNLHSRRVLEVTAASTADGAAIIQWHDNSGEHQLWRLVPVTADLYKIENLHSGRVLDVKGGHTDEARVEGAPIIQWEDLNAANQRWRLVPSWLGA
ncbi:MAG: RICIN domain-containing protein [Egibacteraceae bacterium]